MPFVVADVPVPLSLQVQPVAVPLVAVNVAGSPAQILSLFTLTVGKAFTVTVTASTAKHPVAENSLLIKYVPAPKAVGVATSEPAPALANTNVE